MTRAIRGASMRELRVVGPMVTARAKVLAPVDTGRLRASIGPPEYSRTFTLRPQVSVVAHVDYAKFVHDGTRPHVVHSACRAIHVFDADRLALHASGIFVLNVSLDVREVLVGLRRTLAAKLRRSSDRLPTRWSPTLP
jgi:hypothetical protein